MSSTRRLPWVRVTGHAVCNHSVCSCSLKRILCYCACGRWKHSWTSAGNNQPLVGARLLPGSNAGKKYRLTVPCPVYIVPLTWQVARSKGMTMSCPTMSWFLKLLLDAFTLVYGAFVHTLLCESSLNCAHRLCLLRHRLFRMPNNTCTKRRCTVVWWALAVFLCENIYCGNHLDFSLSKHT